MRSSGKGAWNQVQRKPGTRFWVLCSGVPQTCSFFWQHLVFIGGWSPRQPLPGTFQNFRPVKGKQMLSMNQIICPNSLGIVSDPYRSGNGENPPKIQVPKSCQLSANNRASQQAFLRIADFFYTQNFIRKTSFLTDFIVHLENIKEWFDKLLKWVYKHGLM